MNEAELNAIVDAWVAGQEAEPGAPQYGSDWSAVSQVLGWAVPGSEPELLWRFILAAYRRQLSGHIFGMLAAGPLEDLLSYYGREYIERVEALAREDERFRLLLGGVWRLGMTEEVWGRVQSARLLPFTPAG
jgi:hypothetical protein